MLDVAYANIGFSVVCVECCGKGEAPTLGLRLPHVKGGGCPAKDWDALMAMPADGPARQAMMRAMASFIAEIRSASADYLNDGR